MVRTCSYCKEPFRHLPNKNIMKDLWNKGVTNVTGICMKCALKMKYDQKFVDNIEAEVWKGVDNLKKEFNLSEEKTDEHIKATTINKKKMKKVYAMAKGMGINKEQVDKTIKEKGL